MGLLNCPRRRWAVGLVVEPEMAPASFRAEAERWRDQPFRGLSEARYWTLRGARRVAARWNRKRSPVGAFEVFGPLGKELDGADVH